MRRTTIWKEGPPHCERCGKPLPGHDPLRPLLPLSGRFGEHSPAPVRVVKAGTTTYWCSSRHYKADHPAKPKGTRSKSKKNRGADIILPGSRPAA